MATIQGEQDYLQGLNFYHGFGRAVDYEKAFEHFEAGAQMGNPKSQRMMGTMFKEGVARPVDKTKAIELFQLSADQGDSFSQFFLGDILRKGDGCIVDKQKAIELFLKSSAQGNKFALCSLGEMYRDGEGCEIDKQKAYQYFKHSADRGDHHAQSALDDMENKEKVKQCEPDKKESESKRSPKQKPAGYRLQNKDTRRDSVSFKPSPISSTVPSFLQVINVLRNQDEHIAFQVNQILAATAKLLVHRAKQFEANGDAELLKAYNLVALHEGRNYLSDEVKKRINNAIANAKRLDESVVKQEVQQRVEKIRDEVANITQQYTLLSNKTSNEAIELQRQKDQLEIEQNKLKLRVQDLDQREQKLAQNAKEFEDKCQKWQQRIEAKETKSFTPLNRQQSLRLLTSVKEANAEVEKDRFYLSEKLAKAEEAREKLAASEKMLKERVEVLQNFLSFMEHEGVLPETVHFNKLLKAIKHISPSEKKIKCFISYAWQPNQKENANLQAKLIKIKGDLNKAGIEVMLDIHNLEGDINRYMMDGIKDSDRVLLICTPRFRERADAQEALPNNLQKEFKAALSRQTADPKFIVPIILEGDRTTSISAALPDILSLDLSDPKQYSENMVSLNPKGLIPMLLNLDHNKLYPHLLEGYHAHLKLRCIQCNARLPPS